MPQIDLTTVSGPELRGLLDTARARGQADLAYHVLQEMAARREAEATPRRGKRRSEPRLVDLNLGDPPEPMPEVDAAAPDDEPPLTLAAPEPFRPAEPVPDVEPEEPLEIRWAETRPHPGPPPRRIKTIGFASGMGLGVVGGIVIGLAAAEVTFQPQAQAASPPLATLLAPPAPPPKTLTVAVAPDPAPALANAEVAAAAPADVGEAVPATEIAEAEPSPPAEETPARETAKSAATSARCAAIHTPADRVICEDPDLQRLQKELRTAYANALEAHEDRGLLRQHQLEWRDARNDVSDPDQLARLYQQRIRKLDAAAQEAARMRR